MMNQNNFNNNINTQSTEMKFLPCPSFVFNEKFVWFFQKKGRNNDCSSPVVFSERVNSL